MTRGITGRENIMGLFDVGDVLFDEDVPHLWLFHTLLLTLRAHGKDVLWDDWNATRKKLAAQGPNPEAAIKGALGAYCANDSETEVLWHQARDVYQQMRKPRPYGLLLDGITPVLQDLKRDFHLGVIANQHPPVAQALDDYGITGLFDVVVISETVHLYKPDPAIFQCALDQAGISPPEAIFVGDRPDNDILPAKKLGMKTVRFKRGIQYELFNPSDPAMTADETVTDVSELAAAVRRVAKSVGKARMIIEARDDLVMLEGSLDKNLWPTIQAAANLLLRQNTQGIIIDGSELTGCSPAGAETFRDAMDYIERYRARIVVCRLPENVMEVVRAVPGVRSRLPVAETLEAARNSLRLARTGVGQASESGSGRALQDILVPLLQGDTPETATVLACRLARSEGQQTQVHLAYIFEVPRQLPLNAPLPEEETQASETLQAAENWVRREGLKPMTHVARARDVGEEIIHQAGLLKANIIVLSCGVVSQSSEDFMARVGRPVLDHAPCEVILSKLPPASPV